MSHIDRLERAARMRVVLKEMMNAALDIDRIRAYVFEMDEACKLFGISTEGKTLGHLKVELQHAIDKELGR